MKIAKIIVRYLLALMMVVFGLNKFLLFIPAPELSAEGAAFMGALVSSGYLMALVAIVEIVTGLLLLVNKFVPLALLVLFPVILNAFLFHLFLDIAGIAGAAMALVFMIILFFEHKSRYSLLLKS